MVDLPLLLTLVASYFASSSDCGVRTMAGFFVHLAGGAAASMPVPTGMLLSLCYQLPQGSLPGTWTSLISFCFRSHSVLCLLLAVGRRCSRTSLPACDRDVSWTSILACGQRPRPSRCIVILFVGPHFCLWPLPGREMAAASWAFDIVCSFNSESQEFVWLPRGGVLRPVPTMWDPFVAPTHTLLLRFLRASHAISNLGWVFADATADLILISVILRTYISSSSRESFLPSQAAVLTCFDFSSCLF